jgi:hopanoid biosynthesis associated protein HpnK
MSCRLIINADDFGWSTGVNAAVALLADEGIVTNASLMVAGAAAAEAVTIAGQHPRLGVGLHLALVCAPALLSPAEIPSLADARGNLPDNWRAAGLRYLISPRWRAELRREVDAQFQAFAALGLACSHADAHLHLSLHPLVFRLMLEQCARRAIGAMRIPDDDFELYRRVDPKAAAARLPEALALRALCSAQRGRLAGAGLRTTRRCFGYFRSGALDARYLARLVEELPEGEYELHCHPDLSTESGRAEVAALRSHEFRNALARRGVALHTWAPPPRL